MTPIFTVVERLVLAVSFSLGAIILDLTVIAVRAVPKAFHVDDAIIQATFSAYFLGSAMGQILGGVLSDKYSPTRAILIGSSVFATGSCLCASSVIVDQLIAGRFTQALGASIIGLASRAHVRHRCGPENTASMFAMFAALRNTVSLLVPLLALPAAILVGWRGLFAAHVIIGLVIALSYARTKSGCNSAFEDSPSANEPIPVGLSKGFLSILTSFAVYYGSIMLIVSNYPLLLQTNGVYSAFTGAFYSMSLSGSIVGNILSPMLLTRVQTITAVRIGLLLMVLASSMLSVLAYFDVTPVARVLPLFAFFLGTGIAGESLLAEATRSAAGTAGKKLAILSAAGLVFAGLLSCLAGLLLVPTDVEISFVVLTGSVISAALMLPSRRKRSNRYKCGM